jgi:hypothetical protein
MPFFVAVYPAGGGVENGFHELPILANGQRYVRRQVISWIRAFSAWLYGVPSGRRMS